MNLQQYQHYRRRRICLNVLEMYHQIINTPPSPQAISYENVMSGCGSPKYGDHEKEFVKLNFTADVVSVARRALSVNDFAAFKRFYLDTEENIFVVPQHMISSVARVGRDFSIHGLYPLQRYLT